MRRQQRITLRRRHVNKHEASLSRSENTPAECSPMIKSLTDGGKTTVNWVFNYNRIRVKPSLSQEVRDPSPPATALQSLDTCTAHLFKITLEESFQHTAISGVTLETRGWKEQGEKVSRRIKSIVSPLWWYYIEIKLHSNFLKPRQFSEALCEKGLLYF